MTKFLRRKCHKLSQQLTCSSLRSPSSKFELSSSSVIFFCSFSMSSNIACSSGLRVVDICVVVEVSSAVSFPSNSDFDGGTDTNSRAPRFNSFSRMSMKFCENLWNNRTEMLISCQQLYVCRGNTKCFCYLLAHSWLDFWAVQMLVSWVFSHFIVVDVSKSRNFISTKSQVLLKWNVP